VTGPGKLKPLRSIQFQLVDPDIIVPGNPSDMPHNACHDAVAPRGDVLANEERIARI
jgi:hypothetical protein